MTASTEIIPAVATVLCIVLLAMPVSSTEVLPSELSSIDWGYTVVQPVYNASRTYYSNWKAKYKTCGGIAVTGQLSAGDTQSPINFQQVPADANLKPITFELTTKLRNVSIVVLPKTKLSIELGGSRYSSVANNIAGTLDKNTGEFYALHHIDVRTPSEHTFGGGHRDLEVQLVYRSSTLPSTHAAYNYIVATTFMATPLSRSEFVNTVLTGNANANTNFADVLNRSSSLQASPVFKLRQSYRSLRLTLASVAPVSRNYYRYYGSLTEPPCTENAVWNVYAEPSYMGLDQLATIRRLLQLDVPVSGNVPSTLNFTKIFLRENGEVMPGAGLPLSPPTVQLGNYRPLYATPIPPQPLSSDTSTYQSVVFKTRAHGSTQRPYTVAERYKVTLFKDIIGDHLLAHDTIPHSINDAIGSISVAAVILSAVSIPIALLAVCIGRA